MIRPILRLGDPILKQPSRPIEPSELGTGPLRALAADMAETLADSGGVGLAAPQVGVSLRLVLAGSFPSPRAPDRPVVAVRTFLNPAIVAASDDTEPGWEGCLSIPDRKVRVDRRRAITVAYLDLDGQPARLDAEGFLARVLQHEIDHLDGILTLDHARGPDDVVPALPETNA